MVWHVSTFDTCVVRELLWWMLLATEPVKSCSKMSARRLQWSDTCLHLIHVLYVELLWWCCWQQNLSSQAVRCQLVGCNGLTRVYIWYMCCMLSGCDGCCWQQNLSSHAVRCRLVGCNGLTRVYICLPLATQRWCLKCGSTTMPLTLSSGNVRAFSIIC